MIKIFLDIFRSLEKDDLVKSLKILLILLFIILLEFLGISLIIPIVNLFLGNSNKVIDQLNFFFKISSFESFFLGKIILIIFVIITTLRVCLYFYFDRKTIFYTRSIEKEITIKIYKYIYSKPWLEIIDKDNSSFISKILSDIPIFIGMGLLMCIYLIKDFLVILFTIFFIFYINELYLLNLIIIFILLTISGLFLFKKKIKIFSFKFQDIVKLKYQNINEGIIGLKDLKLFYNSKRILNSISNIENEITKISIFQRSLRIFPRLFLEFFIVIFICFFFIFQFNDSASLIQKIPSLTLFLFLTFRLLPFFSAINYNLQTIRQHSVQINSVIESLKVLKFNRQNFIPNKIRYSQNGIYLNLNKSSKGLIIKDLFFKYNNDDNFIIKNLGFEANFGNIIGIFGESGSGKSTLLDLMLGLLKPTKGRIFFNNIDINLHEEDWRKTIGHISQSVFLFNASVKDNIILSDTNEHSELKLNELIKKLSLDSFIKSLPKGINSMIGDLGKNISGGQKQKIAFLRVLYKSPSIIFLDEATNSIDEQNEDSIFNYLNLIKKNKIIILISHSKRLFKYCNILFELKDGILKNIKNK